MTTTADYRLRDLIERLDRGEPTALAELHGLRFQNGGDAMSESLVFICEFSDGQVTRMTVFTSLGRLDVERGVRLARCAYYSRKRQEPPSIVKARFEQDGKVLEAYSAVDLEDIEDNRPIEDYQPINEHQQTAEDAQTVERIQGQDVDDASGEPPL